jgi:predicted membrane-bound spermidine synthase
MRWSLRRAWLTLLGIIILFAFPISGIAVSLFAGALAAYLVGGGTFGVIVLFVVAFLFGLFLSVYVWEPHVKRVIYRVQEFIVEERDR